MCSPLPTPPHDPRLVLLGSPGCHVLWRQCGGLAGPSQGSQGFRVKHTPKHLLQEDKGEEGRVLDLSDSQWLPP